MKQASLNSSIDQGGGKRRVVIVRRTNGELGTVHSPIENTSCSVPFWIRTFSVPNNETVGGYFDRPGRREAARGGHSITKSPKFIDRPADDDRTNERIEKDGDPSASNHVASSGAVDRANKLTEKYADPSEPNHVASNDAEYSTDYSRDL